jgi:hypothetical protein
MINVVFAGYTLTIVGYSVKKMIEKLNGNSLMLIPYGILSTLVVVDLIKK